MVYLVSAAVIYRAALLAPLWRHLIMYLEERLYATECAARAIFRYQR